MTENKKVKVNQDLLENNISTAYGIALKAHEELLKDLLVGATKSALDGNELKFHAEMVIGNIEDVKDDIEDEVKDLSKNKDVLEALLKIVQSTVKGKEPTSENLDKMLSELVRVLKVK